MSCVVSHSQRTMCAHVYFVACVSVVSIFGWLYILVIILWSLPQNRWTRNHEHLVRTGVGGIALGNWQTPPLVEFERSFGGSPMSW